MNSVDFEGKMRYNCSYPHMQTDGVLETPTVRSYQRKDHFRMATSDSTSLKRCNKCHIEKPMNIHHFTRSNYHKDGFLRTCKECSGTRKSRFSIAEPLPDEGIVKIHSRTGQLTIIDYCDADLAEISWSVRANDTRNSKLYAMRQRRIQPKQPQRETIFLHRVILERMLGRALIEGECVDHINGDSLDNRRLNLRVASHKQNMRNVAARNPQSGFKGVRKHFNKWHASITVDGKNLYLGLFKTPEEAHEAYKTAAKKYFGEFARFE